MNVVLLLFFYVSLVVTVQRFKVAITGMNLKQRKLIETNSTQICTKLFHPQNSSSSDQTSQVLGGMPQTWQGFNKQQASSGSCLSS